MREIADCGGCDAPLALVITCTVSEDSHPSVDRDPGIPERSDKRLTIVDVARMAGVSTATVSRVLNNRDRVSPEIRARVRAVVDAVGFSLNESARALVLRRSA